MYYVLNMDENKSSDQYLYGEYNFLILTRYLLLDSLQYSKSLIVIKDINNPFLFLNKECGSLNKSPGMQVLCTYLSKVGYISHGSLHQTTRKEYSHFMQKQMGFQQIISINQHSF